MAGSFWGSSQYVEPKESPTGSVTRASAPRVIVKEEEGFWVKEAQRFEEIAVSHADAMRDALRELPEDHKAATILRRALGEII